MVQQAHPPRSPLAPSRLSRVSLLASLTSLPGSYVSTLHFSIIVCFQWCTATMQGPALSNHSISVTITVPEGKTDNDQTPTGFYGSTQALPWNQHWCYQQALGSCSKKSFLTSRWPTTFGLGTGQPNHITQLSCQESHGQRQASPSFKFCSGWRLFWVLRGSLKFDSNSSFTVHILLPEPHAFENWAQWR